MSIEIYLAYLAAVTIVLIIPGPTILLVIGHALAGGRRTVLPAVAGVGVGDFVAMTASLTGLGAVLAASATLFAALKWIGAAYLIWLGITMWRADPGHGLDAAETVPRSSRSKFKSAFIVTALNPKGIVFFIAFLPQFVVTTAPVPPQLALLGMTFVVLGIVNAAFYGLLASQSRELFKSPRALRLAHRSGGTALIGAGLLTAVVRQSQ